MTKIKTQLHIVHDAIAVGLSSTREISEVTGIKLRCVASCRSYLKQNGFDVEAARRSKNERSKRSKAQRSRSLAAPLDTKADASSIASTIPVVIRVPTQLYGTDWCKPEVDAGERTVVDFLISKSKYEDDLNAHLEAIEERAGREFIAAYLDQAC